MALTLALLLPSISSHMSCATLECVFPEPGTLLRAGDKLLDVSIDLSSAFSQDCPPISHHRLVVREPAYFRSIAFAPGDRMEVGAMVALFSKEASETLDPASARPLRIATAGITHHPGMFSGADL